LISSDCEIVVALTSFEMTVDAWSQQSHLNLGFGQLFVEDLFLLPRDDAMDGQASGQAWADESSRCGAAMGPRRFFVSSVEAVGKMLSASTTWRVLLVWFLRFFGFRNVVSFRLDDSRFGFICVLFNCSTFFLFSRVRHHNLDDRGPRPIRPCVVEPARPQYRRGQTHGRETDAICRQDRQEVYYEFQRTV
jgi:hypothetical protein